MDGMLQAVVVIFMLFLCAICLFAVVVIVRDMIYESARLRRDRERDRQEYQNTPVVQAAPEVKTVVKEVVVEVPVAAPAVVAPAVVAPAVVEAPVEPTIEEVPTEEPIVEEIVVEPVVEEIVEEPVVEEIAVTEEPAEEVVVEPAIEEVATVDAVDIENAVVFSTHSFTMAEKYATLSSEYKAFFDDIVRHALSKEGVKELKSNNHYDYKIGSYRVVRITIKRGEIICEFSFIDRDFRNYASASNVRMKASATSMKVNEASAVGVAKDGIDLICTQIAEDKEYKKELAREKRRERRKRASESES